MSNMDLLSKFVVSAIAKIALKDIIPALISKDKKAEVNLDSKKIYVPPSKEKGGGVRKGYWRNDPRAKKREIISGKRFADEFKIGAHLESPDDIPKLYSASLKSVLSNVGRVLNVGDDIKESAEELGTNNYVGVFDVDSLKALGMGLEAHGAYKKPFSQYGGIVSIRANHYNRTFYENSKRMAEEDPSIIARHESGILEKEEWAYKNRASALYHELGHKIDFELLRFRGTDGYGKGKPSDVDDFFSAIEATSAYKNHKKNGMDAFIDYRKNKDDLAKKALSEQYEYKIDNSELFARSFEQYISTKTGRGDGYHKLAKVTDDYWSKEEFAPIEKEMDALFEKKGWLNNRYKRKDSSAYSISLATYLDDATNISSRKRISRSIMPTKELHRILAREDVLKKLRCKIGFKQMGAACKPIPKESSEVVSPSPSRSLAPMVGGLVGAGITVALGAVTVRKIYGDLEKGEADVSGLQKISAGEMPTKEVLAKADDFKPGEMIRKGFDITGRGGRFAYHYGIYAGDGKIIEVDGDPRKGGYKVKESPLYKKEPVPTTEYERVPDVPKSKQNDKTRAESLSLAKPLIGTPFRYDLVDSNCESFARAIVYGETTTAQGSALGKFTGGLVRSAYLLNKDNRKGITAQEMNAIFKEKGYSPEVSKLVFAKASTARSDSDRPLKDEKTLDGMRDPDEFSAIVDKMTAKLKGSAKDIVKVEMNKLYLIAFFGLASSKKKAGRSDAYKKLKCKPGFKQMGAVCKPVKQGAGSDVGQSSGVGSSLGGALKILPVGLAAGAILGGIGAAGSIFGDDIKNVSVTKDAISGLEMAPLGKDFNKEAIAAEYDKKFEKGDLVRSAFPLEFDKSKYAYHYAIYAGNGEMIESAPDKAGGAGILKQFAHDPNAKSQTTKYEKVELPPDDGKRPIKSKEHTLKLAESMVGTPFKWNVIESNCESFARTVAYGSIKGAQSEKVSGFGIKAVTSLIDIVDKVALGGVINRGYHSDDIKKVLEQNNYDPELVAAAFKPKQEERRKEIAAKRKDSATSDKKTQWLDDYGDDLADPEEFTKLVKKTSENFSGLSKRLLEEKMFKTYLVALFTSASKPPKKVSKQDSSPITATPQQKMMRAVMSIIQKTFGGISAIARVNRDSNGLITVYFRPLSDPNSLIKFDIGNSIKYKDVSSQRVDSLISEKQPAYVTAYLSAQTRLDRSGQQKKCVKGIPCKGECIPRSSTCEVDIDKVVDAPTIQNLDPVRETVGTPTGDEDIYAMMNIRDLKEEARKKGVMRYSYMTREQLQSAIKVHDSDPLHQEVIRKSLQRQKDISTLKVVKATEIGRAIGAVNPALGRQFNLLSAIGRKYEKNPTEALIYAVPALIGTTKVAMVLLQKQRLSNIKESAGAAVNDAEKYRKDIDENANPEGVNFYVGGYGRGSKDLYDKVANSPLATEEDTDWIKNKTENIGINREGEDIPSAQNSAQGVGNSVTTGYNVVLNSTFKRGKNKEAVELAAKLYAQGTTWRKGADGVLSMPPIQILAAEDGGTIARDAIEILQQMPRDTSTKITGKAIADRIKLVTLGTPYFGESKVDIPEVNLMGDGDPWASLPFNKGSQTKRVTGVGGANQNAYTSSASGIDAIYKNMRSGADTRVSVDKKSGEEAEKARKNNEANQTNDEKAQREAAAKAKRDRVKAETQIGLDKLIRDELKAKAGNSVEELDRLMRDTEAFAKAKKKVLTRIKDERDAAEFARRSGVA